MIDDVQNRAELQTPSNRPGRPRVDAPLVPYPARVPQDLLAAACRVAARERSNPSAIMRQALREYLARRSFR